MADAVLIADLHAVLERGPSLRLALLFGSFARAKARSDSDVDVAILPADPELALADELGLQARLALAARREVDLVRLDRCSPALRFRVARDGIPLLGGSVELSRFRARAGIEHAELEPRLRLASALFQRRLAGASDVGSRERSRDD